MTKERVSILLSIVLLAFICPSATQAAAIMTNQKRVALDPGHGGIDPGLVSPMGIQEQQVTFELAEMISLELSDTFQVNLTRPQSPSGTTDPDTPQQRAAFANQIKADLFVSIHLQQTQSQPPLIFYLDSSRPTATTPSKQMAEITAERFKTLQNSQPRILKAQIIPLENLLMPGILIEPVSISGLSYTPTDRKQILTPHAKTIASAIRLFFSSQN